MRRLIGSMVITALMTCTGICLAQPKVEFGQLTELRTDEGRMSFGTIVSADVVSWSAPDAQDLLIARLWDGVYLYPSKDLQTIGEPIRLCDQLGHVVLMIEPVDWDGDGREEAIGTDRQGKISCLKRVGEFPDLRLEVAQTPLLTADGIPFNIPFVNPKYRLADKPEILWPENFNYTYPTIYRPAGSKSADLIIGDWGGELWFLPHVGAKDGLPVFAGSTYVKRDGKQFAKPKYLLADDQGQTLLVGEGTENGIRYPGGASRPVMYRNAETMSDDLIVLSGMDGNHVRYLQRANTGTDGAPVFKDLGEVAVENLPDEGYDAYNYHAVLAVHGGVPWPDLLISRGCDLAICRNQRVSGAKPKFRFDRWISGRNVPTRGYNFTEILTDARGRRFLLENDSQWSFRELLTTAGKPQLSSQRFPLYDQQGIFQVDGDTDIQHLTKWGFHRAALWDYDGSGRQHLIVGTDKGWLYLLRLERPLGENDRFEFRSFGPLKDSTGKVIRVHHRVVAAPLDLDGDGRLDLVLAGATYGTSDPNPGSGIYFVRNEGETKGHTPILSPLKPLETTGHTHPAFKHSHAQLQSLDLLGNGEKVVVVGTQLGDNFQGYVYRPSKNRIALEHTGLVLPPISIEERLLDLDGDRDWEYIRSGGESLIAKYAPVNIAPAGSPATSQNLAQGVKYQCVTAPNYWGWKNPQHGDLGQLTDGKLCDTWRTDEGEIYSLRSSMGWSGTAPIVVFDLGRVQSIGGIGLHTVLSLWGPWWPATVTVLVSDDNTNFYQAGSIKKITPNQLDPAVSDDVVQASIDRELTQRGHQPSTHWLRLSGLSGRGRYVALVMSPVADTGTIVIDEVEIYPGSAEALSAPRPAQVFSEGPAGWKSYRLFQAIDERVTRDIAALRASVGASSVSPEQKAALERKLDQSAAKRSELPVPSSEGFRAILPLNDLHREVFAVQAELWRGQGLPPIAVWHSHRWDPLSPIMQPDRQAAQLHIVLEKNAVRSDVLNLSNAEGRPRTVRLRGLSSDYFDVFDVPLVDTHALEPVASALVPLSTIEDAYQVEIPAGMTRQIWIRCRSKNLPAGRSESTIKLTSPDDPAWSAEVPITIEVVNVRLPDAFSLHLGGWDYPVAGTYQVTQQNLGPYVAMLRQYGVNTTWSSNAMPTGQYDVEGNLAAPPSRTAMDGWLARFPDAKLYCSTNFGDVAMDDPHRDKKRAAWAADWSAYLQTKRISPDRVAFLIRDEPISEKELKIILDVGQAIKRGEPRFKIFNDLHWSDPTAAPPVIDSVMREACDIQCFGVEHYLKSAEANAHFMERHQRPDLQWWCYTGGSSHRLADPYVAYLLRSWFCFDRGLTGAHFWAFGDGHGGFSFNEYLNDGPTHSPLYLQPDGVLASKSMEAMREGAQDYELLMMLRQRAQQSGDAADIQRTLSDEVATVLQAHRVDQWNWNVAKDRSLADAVRIRVLRQLEQK